MQDQMGKGWPHVLLRTLQIHQTKVKNKTAYFLQSAFFFDEI